MVHCSLGPGESGIDILFKAELATDFSVALESVLKLVLVDQADLKLTEIHLPLPSKGGWLKRSAPTGHAYMEKSSIKGAGSEGEGTRKNKQKTPGNRDGGSISEVPKSSPAPSEEKGRADPSVERPGTVLGEELLLKTDNTGLRSCQRDLSWPGTTASDSSSKTSVPDAVHAIVLVKSGEVVPRCHDNHPYISFWKRSFSGQSFPAEQLNKASFALVLTESNFLFSLLK
ncbi:hypothetical protein U0070_005853 [Myodes glareolus]|uniref:Uncharacterized protein n=1 Tax=Myodes glareolus TaxID=447135 RepID=A0AAW0IIS9_MYOGA